MNPPTAYVLTLSKQDKQNLLALLDAAMLNPTLDARARRLAARYCDAVEQAPPIAAPPPKPKIVDDNVDGDTDRPAEAAE